MAPPTSTVQLDTMYTTTWQLRRKEIINQIFEATPLFLLMTQKKRINYEVGGTFIEDTLQYGRNESVQPIGRGGSVTLRSTETLTVSKWEWKYITGHLLRYFADWQKNRGKAATIKRVNSDIDTLRNSSIEYFEEVMFGDGTGNDGLDIDGLGNIVAVDPTTGTVGGISRLARAWWRNNTRSMSGVEITLSLIDYMTTMFNDCGKISGGMRRFPDMIVTTQSIYEAYDQEAREIGRIMMPNKKIMDLGFGELAFKGQPITWATKCPSGTMRFLNSENITFTVDNIEWLNLGEWLPIVTQPRDRVAHSMSVCNMTSNNLKKHGVLEEISTS